MKGRKIKNKTNFSSLSSILKSLFFMKYFKIFSVLFKISKIAKILFFDILIFLINKNSCNTHNNNNIIINNAKIYENIINN